MKHKLKFDIHEVKNLYWIFVEYVKNFRLVQSVECNVDLQTR